MTPNPVNFLFLFSSIENLIREKSKAQRNGKIINGRAFGRVKIRARRVRRSDLSQAGSKPNKLAPPRPRYKILNMNGWFCICDELLFGKQSAADENICR